MLLIGPSRAEKFSLLKLFPFSKERNLLLNKRILQFKADRGEFLGD